jgi:hypothetical protein
MPRRSLLIAACLLAIPLAAAPTADAARKAPNGFFGTIFDGPIKSAAPTLVDGEFGRMTAAGVQSVRTNFHWGDIQPARGTTTFAKTDVLVRAAAEHGQIVLPVVTSAPRWARKYPAKEGSPPKRVAEYTALLDALVGRYGPSGSFWTENPTVPKRPIRAWQIWNEPNLPYQWARAGNQGFKKVAPAYGKLLKASRKTLRKADRGSKVVLAALTNFSWKVLATLYKSGHIRGSFDVAAVNAYSNRAADFITIADAVRDVLRRNGGGKVPIWFTEFTAPAAKGRVKVPVYQRRFITTDAQMAKVVKASYTAFATKGRRLGVQRAYWYTWASTYQKGHPLGFFEYAGLRRFTGGAPTDRPAVRAYRQVARKYGG